jgi:hypothetical protein
VALKERLKLYLGISTLNYMAQLPGFVETTCCLITYLTPNNLPLREPVATYIFPRS